MLNIISLVSVQGSSRQSKEEIQADKNRLLPFADLPQDPRDFLVS
jgi:hypothetical protein